MKLGKKCRGIVDVSELLTKYHSCMRRPGSETCIDTLYRRKFLELVLDSKRDLDVARCIGYEIVDRKTIIVSYDSSERRRG